MDNFDNNENNGNNTQEDNTSYYSEGGINSAPDMKKKPPKGLIAGICAAVLCIIVVAVCIFILPGISNTFSLAMSSPEKYYEKVEKNYFEKESEKLAKGYDNLKSSYSKGSAAGSSQKSNIKLTVDPSLASLAGLTEIKDIEADINSSVKDKKAKFEVAFKYGGQNLATVHSLTDSEKKVSYFQIPELNKGYIKADSSENNIADKNAHIFQEFLSGNILTASDLKQIMLRYSNILSEGHGDVKLTKNSNLTVGDIKEKYTKITVSYTEKDLNELAKKFFTEAKKDKQLKKLLVDLKFCEDSEYDSGLDNMLKDIESGEEQAFDSDSMTMDIFVNKYGSIEGRSFTFKNGDSIEAEFGLYTAGKKSRQNFTLWFGDGKQKIFELTGNILPDKSGTKGKIKATISPSGAELPVHFEIDYSGLKRTGKENNLLTGKFTFTSSSLSGFSAVLDLKASGDKKQEMELSVSMAGNKLATMSMSSAVEEFKDFQFPGDSDKIYDGKTEAEQYKKDSDLDGFLANIEAVTGLSNLDGLLNHTPAKLS